MAAPLEMPPGSGRYKESVFLFSTRRRGKRSLAGTERKRFAKLSTKLSLCFIEEHHELIDEYCITCTNLTDGSCSDLETILRKLDHPLSEQPTFTDDMPPLILPPTRTHTLPGQVALFLIVFNTRLTGAATLGGGRSSCAFPAHQESTIDAHRRRTFPARRPASKAHVGQTNQSFR